MMSMQRQMAVPNSKHDLGWLQDSLQAAVEVELATIPLYLAAVWTLKHPTAANSKKANILINQIFVQEMLHMGLACNMLSALGRNPVIASADAAPKYPGPLPGGIHPGLTVTVARYSKYSLQNFLTIEYPENEPVAEFWTRGETYATIGDFYTAISKAYDDPNVKLPAKFDTTNQLLNDKMPDLKVIKDKKDAQDAIMLIKQQGEGTSTSPLEPGGTIANENTLAHYYKFGELFHGHMLRANPKAPHGYDFHGAAIDVPGPDDVYPMADVPCGGFKDSEAFDRQYTQLLKQLEAAWQEGKGDGSSAKLSDAIDNAMPDLQTAARALLNKEIKAPSGLGIVGPSFQYRP